MKSKASTPEEYLESIPAGRKEAMMQLRRVIVKNLPKGFKEVMGYGMIGYVVPHSLYPAGYHCNPKDPLPFLNIASQKNHIALYHMGLYSDPGLLNWFVKEYARQCKSKPDMGKSCLRIKNPERIPFDLIGQLAAKMMPMDWIGHYEKMIKRK